MNINTNRSFSFLIKFFLFMWIAFIPMKTSVYQISFIGILGVFFTYLFLHKKILILKSIFIEHKNIVFSFGIILISMTISNSLSTVTTIDSWSAEFHYVFRYFFIFVILIFFHKESIISKKFVLFTVLFSLSFQGIDGISQALFEYDFIKHNVSSINDGLSGATFNRNTFGFFMSIGVSVCTGLLFYNQRYKLTYINIYILSILLFIFLFNLLFSYSRASWLFYGVFFLILCFAEYKKISKKHFLIFLVIAILIALVFFYYDNLFFRLGQLFKMEDSGRIPIWKDVIDLIKQNYIFGYGLMSYASIASQPILSVHNSILEILLFVGLFGFISFALLLYFILREIIQIRNHFYLALFFAFLVITQFDNSIIKSITTLSSLSIFAFFIFAKNNTIEST
ncbi:O-antigen ligase [Sulfurospirillum sp. UCH001]|uniref:O-antigen ligase family protein n=1 Tax=Sulfurospirillum sp. UCH001 TaxID=1581011 RepID=UPI00082C8D68|nr:O-antigen ligase family protein [Sulfurospirillum sp. UCH001]